eukprot:TRINITY_DN10270_c0_g1_i2.p1 TRINITY_DN10270_c0_g1~~TRINITY_DN10270_c0_g1_i2.p1  ORF type:complete len:298 (-),score=78.03 TRINITY_DN10270_c0_g1_i2:55-924(-)
MSEIRQRHPPAEPHLSQEEQQQQVDASVALAPTTTAEDDLSLVDSICIAIFALALSVGLAYGIYNQLFAGKSNGASGGLMDAFGGEQKRQMESIVLRIPVSLKSAYLGVTQPVEFDRQIVCPVCKGSGAHEGKVHTCQHCHGHGIVEQVVQVFPGMHTRMQSHCPVCGGSGKHIEEHCHHCHGRGLLAERSSVNVLIPAGVVNGQKVIVPRKGHEGIGFATGDVIVVCTVEGADSQFTRDGDNLNLTLPISLKEALLGIDRQFEHLDGRKISVKRNQVTSPGNDSSLQF